MSTVTRTKIIDGIVNPAVMSGLTLITGTVTLDSTKTATISFPAKGIFMAMGTIGVAAAAHTKSVSNGVGSVVFTAAANGDLDYIIVASVSETFTAPDAGTSDIILEPKV